MSRTRMHLPSEPHFFKPLLPGFELESLIPVSFFKYLKGQDQCEKAVLKGCAGKVWPVKINGGRFEDGWKEFTGHHDLHVGDFLVFRHEGDMVFHVQVFGPSTCERDYPFFSTPIIKEEKIEIQPTPNKSKEKMQRAKASSSLLKRPYFEAKLTSYSANKSRLHMPKDFARLHGLTNKRCEMIIMDQEGRSWPTVLGYKRLDGQVFIGRWTNCRTVNDLKEGDTLRFEFVKNGKRPFLKMKRLQASNIEAKREHNCDDDQQAGSSSTRHRNVNATSKASYPRNSQLKIPKEEVAKESGSSKPKRKKQPTTSSKEKACLAGLQHPFFEANITSCRVNLYRMCIPMAFARLHCLANRCCKMILVNQEGRSWPAKLCYGKSNGQVYIADGWRAFHDGNDLKPGDSLVFELIGNGKRPVLKISGSKRNPKTEKEQKCSVAQVGSSSTRHPQVVVTIRSSDIRSSKMRIPNKFARRYNLARNCSNVTLMDKDGSSWSVSLKMKGRNIYIGCGWSAFVVANGVREGDVYMLALIKKGENPVLRIHGLKQGTGRKDKYYMESSRLENCEDVKPIIDWKNQVISI